jgi:subtilisin family serine protease
MLPGQEAKMRDYVILERPSRRRTSVPAGDAAEADVAGGVENKLSVAALPTAERARLEQDANFLVAPIMPMKLIEPFEADPAVPVQEAWGLAAVGATTSAFTGQGVTVAVLDTGIDAAHPAFAGMNLVQEDFSGDGIGDRQGHGTHCAGTVCGQDVGGVRIGVARGVARLLSGKALKDNGSGSSDMIFKAIQWALGQGAHVMSMSLGFDFPGLVARLIEEGWPADLATSEALEAYRGNLRMFDELMRLIKQQGPFGNSALVVAAAGNESRRDQNAEYRIAKSLPAAAEDVVSVAAAAKGTPKFPIAPFSNSLADITGPGVGILSAWPGGGLKAISGTSMACPHVAGVAALWYDKLLREGDVANPRTVYAHMITSARDDVFADGFARDDYGLGFVTAP